MERLYIAVATMEKIYLGTMTSGGMKIWMLSDAEYNVAAIFPLTERLKRTVRNFPKPSVGCSTASKSPPMFPPA